MTINKILIALLIPVSAVLSGCDGCTNDKDPLETLISSYAIDLEAIPQRGNTSCWAASLEMLNFLPDSTLNSTSAKRVGSDSLLNWLHKEGYQKSDLTGKSAISWEKIKDELKNDHAIIAYKYFDHSLAHVFVIRGFLETNEGQKRWLMVNDPYPVNVSKVAFVDFDSFALTYQDEDIYIDKPYQSSSGGSVVNEKEVNIYSKHSITTNNQDNYSTAPLLTKNRYHNLRYRHLKKNVNQVTQVLSKIDTLLFEYLGIQNTNPKEFSFEEHPIYEFNYFKNITEFKGQAYELDTNYLFDKNTIIPLIIEMGTDSDSLSLVLERKGKNFYATRFEKYQNSLYYTWSKVIGDAQLLASYLSAKQNSISRTMDYDNTSSESGLITNISVLPMHGGQVFGMQMKGINGIVVADPFHQLKLKPNRRALFRGPNGTHFYRMSDIDFPGPFDPDPDRGDKPTRFYTNRDGVIIENIEKDPVNSDGGQNGGTSGNGTGKGDPNDKEDPKDPNSGNPRPAKPGSGKYFPENKPGKVQLNGELQKIEKP
ncbi:hypothetical protein [Jiulongibacter sp. NS-SX5]|uniref:hypothetical protein n=1 Tax=Jiulongibacter sp. NS-SX5 TaxID=3463854 RepID=UPI004059D99E